MKINNSSLIIAISVLIVALSVGYYFVIFLPDKYKSEQEFEKDKIRMEQEFKANQEAARARELESCLQAAFDSYIEHWNLNCPEYGNDKKTDGCVLRGAISDDINNDYKEDQELCVKKFK